MESQVRRTREEVEGGWDGEEEEEEDNGRYLNEVEDLGGGWEGEGKSCSGAGGMGQGWARRETGLHYFHASSCILRVFVYFACIFIHFREND